MRVLQLLLKEKQSMLLCKGSLQQASVCREGRGPALPSGKDESSPELEDFLPQV